MYRVVVTTSGVVAASVAWIGYDYNTMHGMRRMKGWSLKESLVRLRNMGSTTRSLSLWQLQQDGETNEQVLFSAGGNVYDVTGEDAFAPDGPYGQNWAGRDATMALGTMSLDPKDVNRQDWSSLGPEEKKTLSDWIRYFDEKYLRVANLREYTEQEDHVASGKRFLREHASRPGVVTSPTTGLQHRVLQRAADGSRRVVDDSSLCAIFYSASRFDGIQIMSNTETGPLLTTPSRLQAGMAEAVRQMREGEVWEVVVPPHLGYGERGDLRPKGVVDIRPHEVKQTYTEPPLSSRALAPFWCMGCKI